MTPYLLILAVLLGIAPGLIAHGKGRNFLFWWVYGVVLGPLALLHAILLRPRPVPHYADRSFHEAGSSYAESSRAEPGRRRRSSWRSHWPAALLAAASVAVAIVAVAIYGLLTPPYFGGSNGGRDVSIAADRSPPEQPLPERTSPAQGVVSNSPSLEQSARREPPTVRVTVRRGDPAPQEEQTASAPSVPVERIPTGEQPLERTTPKSVEAPPPAAVATTSPPAQPSIPAAPERTEAAASRAEPEKQPETEKTEKTASAPAASPPSPPAKPAASPATSDVTAVGETVMIVQRALADRGYDPGPANGRAGPKTQAAIKKYQSDRRLQPTGTIDYSLLETLGIVGPRVHAFRPPPGATPGR